MMNFAGSSTSWWICETPSHKRAEKRNTAVREERWGHFMWICISILFFWKINPQIQMLWLTARSTRFSVPLQWTKYQRKVNMFLHVPAVGPPANIKSKWTHTHKLKRSQLVSRSLSLSHCHANVLEYGGIKGNPARGAGGEAGIFSRNSPSSTWGDNIPASYQMSHLISPSHLRPFSRNRWSKEAPHGVIRKRRSWVVLRWYCSPEKENDKPRQQIYHVCILVFLWGRLKS